MLSSAEIQVLSHVVASRLPSKATGTVVVSNEPSIESHLPSVEAYRNFRAFEKLPSLTEETVQDLLAKEKEREKFEQSFSLPRESVFLDEAALKAIFRDGRGWESFYEAYPDSGGVFYLSRVGFSSDGFQALVHVGRQWMGRAGGGELVLLTLADGTITELGAISTWMS
jgi:hypothetical protein